MKESGCTCEWIVDCGRRLCVYVCVCMEYAFTLRRWEGLGNYLFLLETKDWIKMDLLLWN